MRVDKEKEGREHFGLLKSGQDAAFLLWFMLLKMELWCALVADGSIMTPS